VPKTQTPKRGDGLSPEARAYLSTLFDDAGRIKFTDAINAVQKADEGAYGRWRARHLIRWFERGKGAARIGWGAPNDFDRCVAIASEHMTPEQAKGFCNLRHHGALGYYPATHAAMERHARGKSRRGARWAAKKFDVNQPRDRRGRWVRIPGWLHIGGDVGETVHHPELGRGVVQRAGKTTTRVEFEGGAQHTFRRGKPGAAAEHFRPTKPRASRKPQETAAVPPAAPTAKPRREYQKLVDEANQHVAAGKYVEAANALLVALDDAPDKAVKDLIMEHRRRVLRRGMGHIGRPIEPLKLPRPRATPAKPVETAHEVAARLRRAETADDARAILADKKVPELRDIAAAQRIRLPARAKKSDIVDRLAARPKPTPGGGYNYGVGLESAAMRTPKDSAAERYLREAADDLKSGDITGPDAVARLREQASRADLADRNQINEAALDLQRHVNRDSPLADQIRVPRRAWSA